VIAPALCAAVYGFAWFAADEGNIQKLAEQVDVNTDPEKNPTPNQVFHHLWPYVAGTLGMLFESVTCKFSQTKDMDWLCTTALNDDTNAAVALSLLVPPAEYSPTFVRAICARPGALRRTKEIVQIYKTLPREQHDDVVVNACILMAKVAQLPELKADGLGVADFVWMMPDDKAYMYTQYGLEGLAHLWKEDTSGLLTSGGVLRTAELIDGRALMPSKAESAIMNQLVAHHLLNAFAEDRASLLEQAVTAEAGLAAASPARAAPRQTLWQKAGVKRGESELQIQARMQASEQDALRGSIGILQNYEPRAALSYIEQYTPLISMATAAALGAIYGAARGFARAWWHDVTPSVCREISAHVALRSSIGAVLLVATFEAAPYLKQQARAAMGASEVSDYSDPEALKQLVAIDLAYIGAIGVLNYAFPYALLPWACNPAQLLVLPSETKPPPLPPPRESLGK